jgi:hypothetical protein
LNGKLNGIELAEAAMAKLRRGERLQILLTYDELTAVDDWRFGSKMPSRAAAVRELLRRGLTAEGFTTAKNKSKSKDFGVIDAKTSSLAYRSRARRTNGD